MIKQFLLFISFCFLTTTIFAQSIAFEAYVYESGNRGYLNTVRVEIINIDSNMVVAELFSNTDGQVKTQLNAGSKYKITASKDMFHPGEFDLDLTNKKEGEKAFLKMEMKRAPGYQFEITMAEKRESVDQVVNAIKNTRIEVYNNTTRKEILKHEDYLEPDFKVNLLKGNHYTIMIRKKGYLAKRMEAFVDVEGCILCFEGLGSVSPGVSDNLTEKNAMGVLLANVELEKIYAGKTMEINNLYYDLGKHHLRSESKKELDKVITLINDNPDINLELGSHTDSRGTDDSNMVLSQKRAKSAVQYLATNGNIGSDRLTYRGYGETQILNECREGVKCAEKDHAINRRTELKITGTFESDKPFVPLVKMKQAEFMDELIQELSNEEQIVVGADGNTDFLDEKKSVDEEILDKNIVEKVNTKKATAKANTVPEDIDLSDFEKIPFDDGVSESKMNKSAVDVKEQKEEELTEEIKEEVNEVRTQGLKDPAPQSNTSVMNMGLSGAKIVINKSPDALEKDHDIFKKHSNVLEYFNEDGNVYYLIGEFQNKEEADDFLSQVIKLIYPEAFVVEMVNGKIKI